MVKIAVAGAAGRMGSRITAISKEYEGLQLAGVFERKGHKDVGKDIGPLVGIGDTGVKLAESLESIIDVVDLVISFTTVEASLEHLRLALQRRHGYRNNRFLERSSERSCRAREENPASGINMSMGELAA
jgi:4-hydroxy-tetrahydrodipicolinate reductase